MKKEKNWPLIELYLIFISILLVIALISIFTLKKKYNITNEETIEGIIVNFHNSSKKTRMYITLDNEKKYYIDNAARHACDFTDLSNLLVKDNHVYLKYNSSKNIIYLKVNDILVFDENMYITGFEEYALARHKVFAIIFIVLFIIFSLVIINIYKPIKIKFFDLFTKKQNFIIGIILFIFGVILLFGILLIYGNGGILGNDHLGMDNHPFIFITFCTVPWISMILSIIFVSVSGYGTKEISIFPDKKYPNKNNIIGLICGIILIIFGIITLIFGIIKDQELIIYGIILMVIGFIGSFIYYQKLLKKKKEKINYKNDDFIPKTVYEQVIFDYYHNRIRTRLKALISYHSIKCEYDETNEKDKKIIITIENEKHMIEVYITKKEIDIYSEYKEIKKNKDFISYEEKLYDMCAKNLLSLKEEDLDHIFYLENICIDFKKDHSNKIYDDLALIINDLINRLDDLQNNLI